MLKLCTLTSSKLWFDLRLFIYSVCMQLVARKLMLHGVKGIRPNDPLRQDEGRSSHPRRFLLSPKKDEPA